MCIAQIGGVGVYLLFIAKNLRNTLNPWFELNWDYRIYLNIIMIPTLLICSVRNLKYLAPVSILANIFEFYTLGVVFYYIFKDPLPPFDSRPIFGSWAHLPIFFGTGTVPEILRYQNLFFNFNFSVWLNLKLRNISIHYLFVIIRGL